MKHCSLLSHHLHKLSANRMKHYTTAIMRGVSPSLQQAETMEIPIEPISVPMAEKQHEVYVNTLKGILPNIIQLDADADHPDCVFVEDTAVVIDDRAVITRIGAESRRLEADSTKNALEKLGLVVHDMRLDTVDATCDGGDVLYPVSYCQTNNMKKGGKHLFVGISARTNYEGVQYLEQTFPHVEVIPVELGDGLSALHLKSVVTHIDEQTLVVPKGNDGDRLCEIMGLDERGYTAIRVPDVSGCNLVSVNGHILAQPTICDETKKILDKEVEKRGMEMIYVNASEFAKCDGALTCKSILISKPNV